MTKERINPPSVFRSLDHGFSQAVAASGRRTLYVSGQTAWDANKQLVGGSDLHAQARQALLNLRNVVEAGGGTLDDVVSLRTRPTKRRQSRAHFVSSFPAMPFRPPPGWAWRSSRILAS